MDSELIMKEEEGVIELQGVSRWNGTLSYYQELLDWTEEYSRNPKDTTVNVNLDFIDPSSAELLSLFFKKLVKVRKKGYQLNVNWYYNESLENSKAYGYVFAKVSKIRFNFIELS
jgi:hypothetical protein